MPVAQDEKAIWKAYCQYRQDEASRIGKFAEKATWADRSRKGEERSLEDVFRAKTNGQECVDAMKVKYAKWRDTQWMYAPPKPIPSSVEEEDEELEDLLQTALEEIPPAKKAPRPEHITDKVTEQGKHFDTPLVKTLLRLDEYPFLYGSPGAGKTHLCKSLAKDMGLRFILISCANDMFKSEAFPH